MSITDMMDRANGVELDSELADHLEEGPLGPMIRHPLLVALVYAPPLARLYNTQICTKREQILKSVEEGDIERVIWLHERPWRSEALSMWGHRLSDADYWRLVSEVWIDSENIVETAELWNTLLTSTRGERDAIMTEDERSRLAAMDTTLTIYQGHTDLRDDGWSWTLNRDTAVWFAERFAMMEGGRAMLSTAVVERGDVYAYFTRRGENEILISSDCVKERTGVYV